jgi:hypothetical protein
VSGFAVSCALDFLEVFDLVIAHLVRHTNRLRS